MLYEVPWRAFCRAERFDPASGQSDGIVSGPLEAVLHYIIERGTSIKDLRLMLIDRIEAPFSYGPENIKGLLDIAAERWR